MKHSWLAMNRVAMEAEREQCRAEGREMSSVEVWFDQVLGTDLSKSGNANPALNLLDQTIELPINPEFPFTEPNQYAQIVECCPSEVPELPPLNKQDFAAATGSGRRGLGGALRRMLVGIAVRGENAGADCRAFASNRALPARRVYQMGVFERSCGVAHAVRSFGKRCRPCVGG